jgi:type IV pilus assembly protein PilB
VLSVYDGAAGKGGSMPLGESLVNNGVITKEQLEKALEEQKKNPQEKIGQILLRLGFIPVEELKPYI